MDRYRCVTPWGRRGPLTGLADVVVPLPHGDVVGGAVGEGLGLGDRDLGRRRRHGEGRGAGDAVHQCGSVVDAGGGGGGEEEARLRLGCSVGGGRWRQTRPTQVLSLLVMGGWMEQEDKVGQGAERRRG